MELKDILVVSGHSGLFKYISQGRNSVIVESLTDNKRTNISANAKFNMLEEIVVYTEDAEVPLRVILAKIQAKENGGQTISYKSPDAELKKYFAEAVPEYDKSRVYLSDIRKILRWYNLLLELGVTDFSEPQEEAENTEGNETENTQEVESEKSEGEKTEKPEEKENLV